MQQYPDQPPQTSQPPYPPQQQPGNYPGSSPSWQAPMQTPPPPPPPYPPVPGQQQPNWQAGPPQQPPRKKSRKKLWITIAIIVLVLIIIGAVNSGNSSGTTGASATPTQASQQQTQNQPTQEPTATPKPKPSFATFGDGTFIVGKDIKAGTYRTRQGSTGCYYARLKGFSGSLDDIITNENTDDPAIITISSSDKGFQSTNCGTWTKDLSQITTSKTTFTDGMYFVGTDITPGTYKSSGQSGCYYARLSGFSGSIGDILANNNTDTAAIITIAAGDKGFVSTRCGTWTKM